VNTLHGHVLKIISWRTNSVLQYAKSVCQALLPLPSISEQGWRSQVEPPMSTLTLLANVRLGLKRLAVTIPFFNLLRCEMITTVKHFVV
jgi:hypothetical protein